MQLTSIEQTCHQALVNHYLFTVVSVGLVIYQTYPEGPDKNEGLPDFSHEQLAAFYEIGRDWTILCKLNPDASWSRLAEVAMHFDSFNRPSLESLCLKEIRGFIKSRLH